MRPSRQPDVVVLSALWGALWACALGTWLVAPAFIGSHHLHPQRAGEWLVLIAGLAFLFAFGGLFLGAIAGFVGVLVETCRGGPFRHRPWAYGLFVGPLLVVEYAGESLLIHWLTSETVGGLWRYYGGQLVALTIALLLVSILLVWFYRRVVLPRDLKSSGLAWTLGAAIAVGVLVLVRSMPPAPSPVAVRLGQAHPGERAPLVFIGIDGATWRVLQPAIAAGLAPTLQRLTNTGMHGTMDARWPPYWSSAAWASIVSGLPQNVTGVYEDLEGMAPGLPPFQVPQIPSLALSPMLVLRGLMIQGGAIRIMPPQRQLLNGTPVWQLMHDAGVNTAVVRFRFTYPPEGQADVVISDWAGHDEWESFGVHHGAGADTVVPASDADKLLRPFRKQDVWDPALFASLLPGPVPPKPADTIGNPIEALRIASDIDERTFEASGSIVRDNPLQPFLAVYIGGLDSVEHAFWQYRFPRDFDTNPPAPGDVARLGPVMDRYVQYVDDRLGRLLARYAVPPNVVIVSDHGHGPNTVPSNWRGWHAREGVFVAAGPDIPTRSAPITVSYYDVLPTLADLKGLRVLQGANGHSVLDREDGYSSTE